jgi:hypothetical protein
MDVARKRHMNLNPSHSAKIDEANAPCLRLVEWLGFKFMCRLRATSIRLYGLTKEDWAERREILFPT